MNKGLTLTVISRMTSNYGEGLGNISSIQKVFRNGRTYGTRSRESLKNAVMVQSGLYDDLKVVVDGATQKDVDEEYNASNCKALEGGYMNTTGLTKIRKSSFYFTDAVSCDEFVNETRFHNNLYLASTYAKANNINLQEKSKESGLMPYQYEYDLNLKQYSMTVDLDRVGIDENFNAESSNEEKADRVNALLSAIENLRLVVKGNLDNAEPLFVVGGIGDSKTHYFDNVVRTKGGEFSLNDDLKERINKGYYAALLKGDNFTNEDQIVSELNPLSITEFFEKLRNDVRNYYGLS